MKNEIEKALKETLVISNPESIWRAVDKITAIVEREEVLDTSSVSNISDNSNLVKCKNCDEEVEMIVIETMCPRCFC